MKTIAWLALIASACTEDVPVPIGNVKEGQPCSRVSECEPGFACASEVCTAIEQPDITGRAGTPCMADSACAQGLCCGSQAVCREPVGSDCGLAAGSRCGLSADCDVGLLCDGSGACARPGTGSGEGDEGEGCEEISDCRRPLICGANDLCQPPPFFPGVDCTRSEEDLGAFRAYFEVPRGAPLAEFYRQPFPSDVRLSNGKIDLSGHPDPGNVGGIDFTSLYLEAIQEDYDGFGLTEPVFFQFTDALDESTLTIEGPSATVQLLELPEGRRVPIQIQYEREKGQFICASSLAVAPVDGFVLEPRTTYALVITKGVKSFDGQAPIQDGDFAAIIADATPDDAFLAAAQTAFAPYFAGLAGKDEIAVASVYTTGDPQATAGQVRVAVEGAAPPALSGAVRCTGTAVSPCAELQARTCPPESNAFHQIHGKVTSPILQQGTRPYLLAGDGTEGALARGTNGAIMVRGSEDICVAIAVPKGMAMPAGGWPILIYGHGTGGDFLSGMGQVADDMAAEGIAVITFDGSMHGPRQGVPPAARQDPGKLFFNAQNPRAARDNVLQGAGDIHNLVRLARTLELTDAAVGVTARFNPDRVMYFGHSQGTVVGAPFFTTTTNLRAAVFSGAGAEIGLTMVHKRKPNDVASLTRAIFGDQTLSRLHPMIGLMSLFFGPSDATPFAPLLSAGTVDFLHVYGRNDGFTPDVTQDALVRAGGYPIVGQAIRPIEGVTQAPSPTSRNLGGASVGAIQYEPPITSGELEYDGHFVGSRDPAARAAIRNFLGTAARSDAPAEIRR